MAFVNEPIVMEQRSRPVNILPLLRHGYTNLEKNPAKFPRMSPSFLSKKPMLMFVSLLGMFIALAFQLYLTLSNRHHISNAKFSPILAQKASINEEEFHFLNDITKMIDSVIAVIKSYDFIAETIIILLGAMPWIWKKAQSVKVTKSYPTVNYYTHVALYIAGTHVLHRLIVIPGAILLSLIFGLHVHVDFFEIRGIIVEIIAMFISMGIFSLVGKALPFIVASVIPIGHHILIILSYYYISSRTVPFDFSTPHGKAIRPFLEQQGFPLDHVFFLKRMHAVNAAYSGIWPFSRFIILFEGMVQATTPEQLLGAVAHEVGHGAYLHQLQSEIYFILFGALLAFLCYRFLFTKSVYEAFGFTDNDTESPSQQIDTEKKPITPRPFVPKLVLAVTILPWLFAPLLAFGSHAHTVLKHFGEYQADGHAMHFGFASHMSELFFKMMGDDPQLVTHPVYDYVKRSHPTITRRINRLGLYELHE